MRFLKSKWALFAGAIAAGAGLMGLTLMIPSVHASLYGDGSRGGRGTEYFMMRDIDTVGSQDIVASLGYPSTDETLTLTTGWVKTGYPKCGSQCTGTCGTSGAITSSTNFPVGSTYYGQYLIAIDTTGLEEPRIPTSAYMKSGQLEDGTRMFTITDNVQGGSAGQHACIEVVNSETWTFFKYSGSAE